MNYQNFDKCVEQEQVQMGVQTSAFKIDSSAFCKVVPSTMHHKLFKNLPSLLKLSENLCQNQENTQDGDFSKETEGIFEKIYAEVRTSFLIAKATLKGKHGFVHPIHSKKKKARRGVRNIKRQQDAILIEEIYSKIKQEPEEKPITKIDLGDEDAEIPNLDC